MKATIPSLVIAGLSGGAGKTLCTIGLLASLKKRGFRVAPFKKGPDFIDPAWLSIAASRPCHNLDMFMMKDDKVRGSFEAHGEGCDIRVIEGNRGLFDGMDKKGSYSTAVLAKLLNVKIVLVLDCTKMTGTAAALVMGCKVMDPEIKIMGVILNKVGGARHQRVLKESIEHHAGIPVLGAVPKLKNISIFERHLGLMPPKEHKRARKIVDEAGNMGEHYLDIGKIIKGAKKPPTPGKQHPFRSTKSRLYTSGKKVGIIYDRAFNFYYPENLRELERHGAKLIKLNALRDKTIPDVNLLYIGGGFPETSASRLADNLSFKEALKKAIKDGLPVYAECGGVVYLGNKLHYKHKTYPMAGIFPVEFDFSPKPRGHGYTILKIIRKNPFYRTGTLLRGHEFHYTGPLPQKGLKFAAEVKRGFGFDGKQDGLIYKNVFATYTHVHAYGVRNWAKGLLSAGTDD
ncbi:cobyrinate a,c-diamide synthase [Fibrobacterota bacterium]